MGYPYGTKGPAGARGLGRGPAGMSAFPVVGKGLPGLPKRAGDAGEFLFEHTSGSLNIDQTWLVPLGVTSISVLFVTNGAGGQFGKNGTTYSSGEGGAGGAGGKSYYRNDIKVIPGQIVIFGRDRFNGLIVPSTFVQVGEAGAGGWGAWGGLSTQGIIGIGGTGVNLINGRYGPAPFDPEYGGQTQDYAGWDRSTGTKFGAGGGGGGGGAQHGGAGGYPGSPHWGGLRIIWPGDQRKFPDTRTRPE